MVELSAMKPSKSSSPLPDERSDIVSWAELCLASLIAIAGPCRAIMGVGSRALRPHVVSPIAQVSQCPLEVCVAFGLSSSKIVTTRVARLPASSRAHDCRIIWIKGRGGGGGGSLLPTATPHSPRCRAVASFPKLRHTDWFFPKF